MEIKPQILILSDCRVSLGILSAATTNASITKTICNAMTVNAKLTTDVKSFLPVKPISRGIKFIYINCKALQDRMHLLRKTTHKPLLQMKDCHYNGKS